MGRRGTKSKRLEGHDKVQGKLSGEEVWEQVLWFVFALKGSPLLPAADLGVPL